MLFESIRSELDQVHDLLTDLIRTDDPLLSPFLKELSERRGKMVRPALVLLCARMISSVQPIHIRLAAVVELIHTASLLHDDVIDQATMRRHHFTANAQWGNTAAVLMGDYVLSKAFSLMAQEAPKDAAVLLCRTAEMLCAGELKQNLLRSCLDVTEQDYFNIIASKTAALFDCSCRLGAIASGANPVQIDALGAYGRNFGMSFQIVDDLTDIACTSQTAGKTLGTDLLQEKLTLAVIHWLHLDPTSKQKRAAALSAVSAREFSVLLRDSGSMDYARSIAAEYTNAAIAALSVFAPSETAAELAALAKQVLSPVASPG